MCRKQYGQPVSINKLNSEQKKTVQLKLTFLIYREANRYVVCIFSAPIWIPYHIKTVPGGGFNVRCSFYFVLKLNFVGARQGLQLRATDCYATQKRRKKHTLIHLAML